MTKLLKNTYISAIFLFLYAPILVLIIYSFNNSAFSATWSGATLSWYKTLFHDPALLTVAGHSLLIGFSAATIAAIVGALGAFALFKYNFFAKKSLSGMIFILIVVPDLVFGISLLMLYSMLNIQLGFITLLISHVTFCLPFVIVTLLGRLSDLDKYIFEAAKDLGASDFTIFAKVILPLLIPALVAGWLLSFTLSLDDVIISFFVTGPSFQILPLYIYSLVHVGITPEINALCTLMFIAIAMLFAGLNIVSSRAQKNVNHIKNNKKFRKA